MNANTKRIARPLAAVSGRVRWSAVAALVTSVVVVLFVAEHTGLLAHEDPHAEPAAAATTLAAEATGKRMPSMPSQLERRVYTTEYSNCKTTPIEELAREYGGDPARPLQVALRMEQKTYAAWLQAAAYEGCVDALRNRPPRYPLPAFG